MRYKSAPPAPLAFPLSPFPPSPLLSLPTPFAALAVVTHATPLSNPSSMPLPLPLSSPRPALTLTLHSPPPRPPPPPQSPFPSLLPLLLSLTSIQLIHSYTTHDAQAAANASPAALPASTPAADGVLLAGNAADALSDASAFPGAAGSPAPARSEDALGSTAQVDSLCRAYFVRLSSHRRDRMQTSAKVTSLHILARPKTHSLPWLAPCFCSLRCARSPYVRLPSLPCAGRPDQHGKGYRWCRVSRVGQERPE